MTSNDTKKHNIIIYKIITFSHKKKEREEFYMYLLTKVYIVYTCLD